MWPLLTFLSLAAGAAAFAWSSTRERDARSRARQAELALAALKTDRHLALTEEQTKQQTVFNSMIEGLLILDEHGKVQFVNPTLGTLFGLDADIRGRTLLEALRLHELQDVAQAALVGGRVSGHEITLPGREPRVLQVNAASFRDPDRAHAGTILVFHDLTRIKQLS